MKKNNKILIGVAFLLAVFGFVLYSFASDTASVGEIDSEIKYAWSENGGWINFGDDNGEVEITDLELTGYAWSENFGWISLNCSNNDVCGVSNYKISNDAEGNLSGYAWGENIGWINFDPSDGGVSIDSNGSFSGYAWGENTGWIVFSCEDLNICDSSSFLVKTDWRPLSAREDDDEDDEDDDDVEISDVKYYSTDTTITIKWETNHEADSRVKWGINRELDEEENGDENKEKHKIILENLQPDTKYYFRVKSVDEDEQSDRSKIYNIYTKKSSAFFVQRPYSNFDDTEKSEEVLQVDVSDENLAMEETQKKTETFEQERSEWKILSWIKISFFHVGNFFSRVYISIKNTGTNLAFSIKNSFLTTQKKIQRLADDLRKKKEVEVAQITEDGKESVRKIEKYYSTKVSRKNNQKRIAEVKFQLLDKKEKPLVETETTLFSDPQTVITDDLGIAAFKDVLVGEHTLAFNYEGEDFRKKVDIGEPLTEEGIIRAEIVQIKAEREKIALWMWGIILAMIIAFVLAGYFGWKYYELKKIKNSV